MKKVLITGSLGFVGYYLIQCLKEHNYKIYGTKLPFESNDDSDIEIYNVDLQETEKVFQIVEEIKPDIIFHLAAQSSVKKSWENPNETINININGTINILEAVRKSCPNCKILLIGSSEEYGETLKHNEKPSESSLCVPQNIYAITKITQEYIGKLYCQAYGLNIIMTRSFNHFGPKQSPNFVISDFCKQVAEIEENNNLEKVIRVGNLESYRDFTDVRDIVAAYHLLITKGQNGEIYNVGSGKSYKISDILSIILQNTRQDIKVETDDNKKRPIDIYKVEANIQRIQKDTCWEPHYSINDTIKDTLDYWRKKVKEK